MNEIEMKKEFKIFWYKAQSEYKPDWITDNPDSGWNSGSPFSAIQDFLDSNKIKFDTAYEITFIVSLKEIKK